MFNRFSSSASQPAGSGSFFGAPAGTGQPGQSSSPFSAFGSAPTASAQVLGTPSGTPAPPYAITNELENGGTIKLLSISAMPAYRHLSQEEIRVDDYLKGRKGPSAFPGANNSSAFSQPFSSSSTTGLGGSGFGGSSTGFGSGTGFATSTTGSGFGGFGSTTPKPATTTSTFGGFGSTTAAQPTTSGFGTSAFGASSGFGTTGSTGGFGSSIGGFGTPAAPSTGTNVFGSGSNLFGGSTGSSGFGTSTTPQPSSGFGTSTTPQPPSGFGSFGSTATSAFGTPSTSGLFGQPLQAQPQSTGFGGFGSTGAFGAKPPATPSSSGFFGIGGQGTATTAATPSAPAATPFGGFGTQQPAAQQQQQPSTGFGGLFNSSTFGGSTNTAAPSNIAQPSQQPAPLFGSTGLFGSTSTPSTTAPTTSQGLFQSTANTTNNSLNAFRPATTTGSSQFGFNAAPSIASSAFSNSLMPPSATTPLAPTTTSSLFGSSSNSTLGGMSLGNVPATSTTGSFFNKPPTQPLGSSLMFPTSSATPSSLSNNLLPTTSTTTTSSFNFPNVAPPTSTTATASTGSLSLAPPLPSIYSTRPASNEPSTTTIQRSPVKFTPRTSFRIKPRESYNLTTPIPLNFGISGATGNISSNENTILVPRKLIHSGANMKKLVIPDFSEENPKAEGDNLANSTLPAKATPVKANQPQSQNIITDSMAYGQFYTFPPIKILKTSSPEQRREIKNFVIGQKGVGEIRFLVPVDLSEIDPESLFGHYVEFCEGEAVLYPDPEIPKPEPGLGLNLPAQVRLDRIWAQSKGSRDPIIDPQNEKVVLFAKKLKETEGTNFVSYDPINGTWIFTVDHF